MAGFRSEIVYANNGDFSKANSSGGYATNGLQTNGQMWIGTTVANAGGTKINVGTVVSPDSSVTVGYTSPNITLSVPAGAGLTLGAFGTTPNADGLTLSSGVLNMQPASAIFPGGVSTAAQTLAGAKTFSSLITGSAGLTVLGQVLLNVSGGAGVTIGSTTGTSTFSLNTGTGGIFIASAGTSQHISLGNDQGTSYTHQLVGSGGWFVNGQAGSNYAIGAATIGGLITIGGTSQTGTITLGSSDSTNSVNIGAGDGDTTVNIGLGIGGSNVLNLGNGSVDNVVNLGSLSAGAQTIISGGTASLTLNSVYGNAVATPEMVTISPAGLVGSNVMQWSPAIYVVSKTAGYGNYTTISSAIIAATTAGVPADIIVMPGVYTEDFDMAADVNITGWGCDGLANSTSNTLNNVIIVGLVRAIYAGNATISNVTIQSNGSGCIAALSNFTCNLAIKNCQINAIDTFAIDVQGANVIVDVYNTNTYCQNATTNIAVVQGKVNSYYCNFYSDHSALSTNSVDACVGGTLNYNYCTSSCNILSTAVVGGTLVANYSSWTVTGTAGAVVNLQTSSPNSFNFCTINAGSNVAINVISPRVLNLLYCAINSTNTNTITGSGTINYAGVTFGGTSNITVTTQNPVAWPTKQGGTGLTSYTTGQTLYASATNVLSKLSIGSTGQVLTVSGGLPTWSTPSIIPLTWIDQSTSTTALSNRGYFATAALTLTLPASPSQSDIISIASDTAGIVVVQANTGQQIRLGQQISSTAGSATNSLIGDSLNLTYRASDSLWMSISDSGNWALA